MPNRVIPLEPVPPGGGDEGDGGALAFTDVVVLLHLEAAPSQAHGSDTLFESEPVAEAAVGAFGLGCAVGVDFPARVLPILEQTHPGESERIAAECAEPLERQVAAARQSTETLAADDFLYDLLETLDESERVDAETAQNAVSMSFEYGLLLARVSRSAALVLRNAVNRSLEDAMRAPPPEGPDAPPPEGPPPDGEGAPAPSAPDPSAPPTPEGEESVPPFESLQELAAEMMAAYEADVGFGE